MSFIQKLESLHGQYEDDEQTPSSHMAAKLRSIIEEYKNAQEPFGYFKAEPFGWTDCAETDEGAIALYENPPLSDETVKDAERYRWLRGGGKDLGGEVFMYGYSPKGLDESIDEAMKAKA
jgi:hypothetical protein